MYGIYGKTINTTDLAVAFLLLTGIAAISVFQITPVYADDINYAGSVLANPWTGETAAIGQGNNFCATAKSGESGYWQNFGIKIPDKSTITGIEVLIDSSQTKSGNNLTVTVGKGAKVLGTTAIKTSPVNGNCASSTVQNVGGPTELWGLSWTASEINSKTFGVQVQSGTEDSSIQLDSIGIIVHYASNTITKKPLITSTGPTNLVATAVSQSIINLSWSPPSDGSKITNYIIERKLHDQSDFVVINNVSPQFLTYSDASLLGNTLYTYRVSAINSAGTTSFSNVDDATTMSFVNGVGGKGDITPPSASSINFSTVQNGTMTAEFDSRLAGYSGDIPTQIMHTGVQEQLQVKEFDNSGIAAIKHVGVLMHFNYDALQTSDTYFVYDEGAGLTVSDPLRLFGNVQVHRTYTATEMMLTFTFTPQRPVPITDLIINSWDDHLNSKNTVLLNAFEIQGEDLTKNTTILQAPVPYYKNFELQKYVLDSDGHMIPYDAFGKLDNKFLRLVPKPFVYGDTAGKSNRDDDKFFDKIVAERIKAKEIADILMRHPIYSEEQKIFKVDKVFKYPNTVGKANRSDVKSMKEMLEKENTKAQTHK